VSSDFKGVLRERVEGLVRARMAEVEGAVESARQEIGSVLERLHGATAGTSFSLQESPALDQISAEIAAQVGQAAAESSRLSGDLALLRDSVVDIDSQSTQADVLNALVERAYSFAPRVVLFVVKGDDAIAWAARGFDDEQGDDAVRAVTVADFIAGMTDRFAIREHERLSGERLMA
jgi:dGTP triphosphohydrolase